MLFQTIRGLAGRWTSRSKFFSLVFVLFGAGGSSGIAAVQLLATTSNPALLPELNIGFEWNGPACTVTFAPLPDSEGSATVRLAVTDNVSIAPLRPDFDPAGIQPPPPNTAPLLSEFGNQTVPAGIDIVYVPFYVTDAESPASDLIVEAFSDNASLLPNSNISLDGATGSRTLILRLIAGQSGSTTVTVRVGDGELISTRTLVLSVVPDGPRPPPPNTAPYISEITDQVFASTREYIHLPFTIGDAETPVANLTVHAVGDNPALISELNLFVYGTTTNRLLVARVPINQAGTVNVVVRVGDGQLTSTRSFILTVTGPPPNRPPFIPSIAPQTIPADADSISIPFTIGDPETPADLLTLSAWTDDPEIVPDENLLLFGNGANRTLIIRREADATGDTTVSIKVDDGQHSTATTFNLMILPKAPPPNTAPFISEITDQVLASTGENIHLPFTIGDAETSSDALTLSVWTDDPSVVPDENLFIFGNGANRSLTVRREADAIGDTTVSVMVGDGEQYAVTTFDLSVIPKAPPPNTAPFISSVANQTIEADGGAISISLNLSDAESPPNTLSVEAWADDASLIPDGNISLDGSGTARMLVLRPAPNQTGSTTLELSVSDGELITTTSFVVTVTPDVTVNNPLRIQAIRRASATAMTLTWAAEPGQLYQVLAKDRVDQTFWSVLSVKLTAYGSSVAWTDLAAVAPSRIYRIRKLPEVSPAPAPPRLVSISPAISGEMELRWTGQPGANYRVLAKERLDQPEWAPISGELTAEGVSVSWVDHNAWGFDSRFYRIELRP